MLKHPYKSLFSLIALAFLCSTPKSQALDLTTNLTIRGVSREFIVHIPPSYTGSTPTPLLFMFHGLTSDSTAAASSYYNWKNTADENDFIAIFPDSLDGFPLIWPSVPTSDKYWDFTANSGDSQDLDFVTGMVAWATANYNCRTSHIFTTGHSYGAFFSYYAATWLRSTVAAFGEHSGGLNSGVWPTSVPTTGDKLSGILIHSTGDATVPYVQSSDLHTALQANGHTSQLITLPAGMDHEWDNSYNQTQWNFFMANAPVIDDDLDTMPDAWENANGLNTGLNDAATDSDSDGLTNLEEYIADTNPTNIASRLEIETISSSAPRLITFNTSTQRIYTLQTRLSMTSGSWTNVPGAEAFTGQGSDHNISHTNAPSTQAFYRLQVNLP